ncbi:hypothetical protein [Streptomyces sp. NPDC050528]|uniref:hypothetical protein n=1 Tax=unclassified Streptomyces TaxID=2593676 RepID=UPI0037920C73
MSVWPQQAAAHNRVPSAPIPPLSVSDEAPSEARATVAHRELATVAENTTEP